MTQEGYLTDKQAEIVREFMRGGTRESVAERMGLSAHTVKNHLTHIFMAIEVGNYVEMILWAIRHGDVYLYDV